MASETQTTQAVETYFRLLTELNSSLGPNFEARSSGSSELFLTSSGDYFALPNTTTAGNLTSNVSGSNFSGDYVCFDIIVNAGDIGKNTVRKFCLFTSLVFVIVGLVGNTLSMIVFSSREMRTMSSNVYLLVLSVSDSCYLISVFMTDIFSKLRCYYFVDTTYDIYNKVDSVCKILQFLLDLFSNYSTCLILAFTVERFLAVHRPVKFKEICTVRRARIACIAIFGIISICITPHHFLYMQSVPIYGVCTIERAHEAIFAATYAAEVIIFRITPVISIAVLNVYIMSKVALVQKQKRRRASSSRKRPSRREDKSMQLTIILILVSTSYIVAYIPTLVHFIFWMLQRQEMLQLSMRTMDIYGMLSDSLYISGFAVNFFLYTVSGRIFRKQLQMLLCETSKKGKLLDMTEMTAL